MSYLFTSEVGITDSNVGNVGGMGCPNDALSKTCSSSCGDHGVEGGVEVGKVVEKRTDGGYDHGFLRPQKLHDGGGKDAAEEEESISATEGVHAKALDCIETALKVAERKEGSEDEEEGSTQQQQVLHVLATLKLVEFLLFFF